MKKLYQLLLDRWNQKTDTVLVTIVEGNGSVPRTTGAYMVVAKNGRIYGTIGGGNLEYQAVKKPWNWQEQLPIMWKTLIWEPEKTANWAWSVGAE